MRERRQFEVIESRQMDHLRVFHDVARTLTTSLELEEILLAIMDKMANFFGPERWSLLMVDEKVGDLYYAIAIGEDAQDLRDLRVEMGQGIAGWVARTGNPLVVPDVALDPHWSAFSRNHPDLNIQSIACVPIRSAEKTLGVIQLLNSKLDLLSEYSISFLRILCDYAAIAIVNARSLHLIQQLSITDDATGLYNARRLYSVLDEQVMLGSTPFGLLFLDLDYFKSVNDTHGHLVGSKLLREIGELIHRVIKEADVASLGFRYGGDEFVVVVPGADKDAGTALSRTLCRALRDAVFLESEGMALRVSGSFGLATYPEDGDGVQSILAAADSQLYEVKNTTRDNLAVAGRGLLLDIRQPQRQRPAEPAEVRPPSRPTPETPVRSQASPAVGVRVSVAASARAAAHPDSPARPDVRRSPILQG